MTTGDLLLQAAVMQWLEPVQCSVTQPGPAGGRALTRDREPMVIVSSIQAPQAALPSFHTRTIHNGGHTSHTYTDRNLVVNCNLPS